MFDHNDPVYAPLLLPSDEDALATCGPLQAAILSATTAVSHRLESFRRLARRRAAKLIVDPRTAGFQFEGYMWPASRRRRKTTV